MFTGIVERVGRVVSLGAAHRLSADAPITRRLAVDAGDVFDELAAGASVAINGVCLTLVSKEGATGGFDVVMETLQRTNLSTLRPGAQVNVERSLRPSDRMDGHFVQGHVDALGRVVRVDRRGGERKLWVQPDAAAMRYVIPKGSVALDGVSLTVVDVREGEFSVALIPATLERTTLGLRQAGDAVNIETDVIARLVVSRLEALGATGDDGLRQRLAESGMLP